jgi:hypothetical protein
MLLLAILAELAHKTEGPPAQAGNCSVFGENIMAKARIVPLTDAAYAKATEAGRQSKAAPTAVVRASVHALRLGSRLGLSLELRNGAVAMIPVKSIPELASHPAKELKKVTVDRFGEGLLWPSIDVAISASGLLEDFFGYATRAKVARAGGRARTPAKIAAAHLNGRKGGRPKRRVA